MREFKCFTVTLKHLRFISCLLVLLSFSQISQAADYYWYWVDVSSWTGSSPSGTCTSRAKDIDSPGYGYTFESASAEYVDVKVFRCKIVYKYTDNSQNIRYFNIQRMGDSCPSGTNYDTPTGQCLAPSKDCSSTKGSPFPARGPNAPVVSSGGRNYVATPEPPKVCYEQCSYSSTTGRSSSCYRVKGSTDTGFCNYLLEGNGESCNADSYSFATAGDSLNSSDTTDVPPSPAEPTCGTGWSYSGTTCVKNPTDSTDPKDPSDPTDPSTGGGSGGSGGGTGGGTGGDTGTTPGTGTGGSTGGDSGSGTGSDTGTTCDPSTDPNKCGGKADTFNGEACDKPIDCVGDAFQCAVFRQQKKYHCDDVEFAKVDTEKLKKDITSDFGAAEYQPIKATAETTFNLDTGLNTSSRFAKACPLLPSWEVPRIDGGTTHVDFNFVDDICKYLGWLGYILVAFAIRRAAEIIALGMN